MGAGRPKTLSNPVKAILWFEREDLERAKEFARSQGKTLSELMRAAVRRLAGGRRPRPRRSSSRSKGEGRQ
jgi:hypothetical protein